MASSSLNCNIEYYTISIDVYRCIHVEAAKEHVKIGAEFIQYITYIWAAITPPQPTSL